MSNKRVFLLVDNRGNSNLQHLSELPSPTALDFKGSAFKATEVDAEEELLSHFQDYSCLSQLQKKIQELQQRVCRLERTESVPSRKKKNRRIASQIERSYKCSQEGCGKLYGSQTSLKNHLKLKHKTK